MNTSSIIVFCILGVLALVYCILKLITIIKDYKKKESKENESIKSKK